MTALAAGPSATTAAASERLPSFASSLLPVLWTFYLTVVLALSLWVAVPTVALGWESATIISGSMEPVLRPGDVVIFEPYGGQEIAPGSVITFHDDQQDRLVTHRVVETNPDGTFRTRGDANAVDDPTPVAPDRVTGVGRLVVPSAGLPMLWAHQGRTHLLLGFGVLTLLAAAGAARAVADRDRDDGRAPPGRPPSGRRTSAPRTPWARRLVVGGFALMVLPVGAMGVGEGLVAAFFDSDDNPGNTFAATTLNAPTGLSATGGCLALLVGPKVDLSWTAAVDATGYSIRRSTTSGGPYTEVDTTAATTYTDTSVNSSTTYYYVVRSTAGGWQSVDSTQASAATPALCL